MGPKKSAVKMNLDDFLQDESFGTAPTGSWADEEMPLPSLSGPPGHGPSASSGGPPPRDSTPMDWNAGKRDFGGSGGMGMGGGRPPMREPREPREPVPIPDEPPYTARFLNLDYSVTEDAIASLFEPTVEVVSIRIPQDNISGRPRGFAFVEFKERKDLESALELTGTNFLGRELRVYVADKAAPNANQDERFAGDWRSSTKGPLPPKQEPDHRDYSNWERRGPLPPRRGSGDRSGGPPKPRGRMDEKFLDLDWERKGPLPPRSSERKSSNSGGNSSWRSADEKPRPRAKLNLAPRTVGTHENTPAEAESRPSALFGAAKPVDTTKKLLEIEEKARQAENEKLEAAKQHKEKLAAEQEEKKKKEAERAEQVRKRFNLLKTEDGDDEQEQEAEKKEEPSARVEEKTEAEKILAAEASKEDLAGDWEVVNNKKK